MFEDDSKRDTKDTDPPGVQVRGMVKGQKVVSDSSKPEVRPDRNWLVPPDVPEMVERSFETLRVMRLRAKSRPNGTRKEPSKALNK